MPEVSIIIPVYNVAMYIEKAIESILNQTFKDFEVIIVDDGSTDESMNIIKKYVNDSRLKVVQKENRGVSAARNDGIQAATGTYISFIDSDDEVDKNFLTKVVGTAKETQADMVMFGYYKYQIDGNEKIISRDPVEMKPGSYSRTNPPDWQADAETMATLGYIWNKLYKREYLNKHDIRFKEKMHFLEDIDFNALVFSEIKTFVVMENCFYHYKRRAHTTLVSTFRKDDFDSQLQAIRCREQILRDWGSEERRVKEVTALLHAHAVKSYCVNLFLNKNDLTFSAKHLYLSEVMKRPLTQERIKSFSPHGLVEWAFKITIEKKMSFTLAILSLIYSAQRQFNSSKVVIEKEV